MDKIVLQNFNLYIYKDIADLIYYYADSSTHKDYMEYLVEEIKLCIPLSVNYTYRNIGYITMTVDEMNAIGFPTNLTAPEYDEHNAVVYRIKQMFGKIKYYRYNNNSEDKDGYTLHRINELLKG